MMLFVKFIILLWMLMRIGMGTELHDFWQSRMFMLIPEIKNPRQRGRVLNSFE